MRMHEFVDEGLGHSSYVIDLGNGDRGRDRPAALPDRTRAARRPARAGDRVDDRHPLPRRLRHGQPRTRWRRRGAVFVAPAASHLETPHRPVVDGEIVELAPESR